MKSLMNTAFVVLLATIGPISVSAEECNPNLTTDAFSPYQVWDTDAAAAALKDCTNVDNCKKAVVNFRSSSIHDPDRHFLLLQWCDLYFSGVNRGQSECPENALIGPLSALTQECDPLGYQEQIQSNFYPNGGMDEGIMELATEAFSGCETMGECENEFTHLFKDEVGYLTSLCRAYFGGVTRGDAECPDVPEEFELNKVARPRVSADN